MAISDLVTRTLIRFQGDTTDLKAKIKDLAGEEKKLAELQLKGVEDHNKSLDGLIGKLSAVGVAYGALRLATDSLNVAKERSRLESAAAGVSLSRLADATKGLKRETDLLSDAARLNHGAIKLTTEQMVIAEQAMLQYTRQGHDNAKAHDAVLQAVTSLKIDGLKDLGVFVDTAGLSMEKSSDRGEILKRVFGELTKASAQFANQSLSDAEKLEVTANRIGNAIDRLKANVGKGLQAGVGYVERAAEGEAERFLRMTGQTGMRDQRDAMDARQFYQDIVNRNQMAVADVQLRNAYVGAQEQNQGGAHFRDTQSEMIRRGLLKDPGAIAQDLGGKLWEGFKEGAKRGDVGARDLFTPSGSGTYDPKAASEAYMKGVRGSLTIGEPDVIKDLGFGGSFDIKQKFNLGAEATSGVSIFGAEISKALQDIPEARRLTNEWLEDIATRTRRKSIAEQIVGDIPSAVELVSSGFASMTDAMGTAWAAAITGADSFGGALKKAAGNALLGTSKELFGVGVKESVLALASLALGPLGGASASGHAAAAAAAFAGAGITGAIAAELGAGGSGAAPRASATNPGLGAAPGAGGSGAAPGREQGPRTVYHIIGDRFDTETNPRRRLRNAKRLGKMLDRNSYAADH